MQLIVVACVYVQAKSYARADDRCCHRIQTELGPASKRDVFMRYASPHTPSSSHLQSHVPKPWAARINQETSVARRGALVQCAYNLSFRAFIPPRSLSATSIIVRQAVVLRSVRRPISEHFGCCNPLPRHLNRMPKEGPRSLVPRTRISRPMWVSSLP
jgi:hypothetical protein